MKLKIVKKVQIFDRQNKQIGAITKVMNELTMMGIDTYEISCESFDFLLFRVPKELDVKMKAAILGATFLLVRNPSLQKSPGLHGLRAQARTIYHRIIPL